MIRVCNWRLPVDYQQNSFFLLKTTEQPGGLMEIADPMTWRGEGASVAIRVCGDGKEGGKGKIFKCSFPTGVYFRR
jgi:hypothetical protein